MSGPLFSPAMTAVRGPAIRAALTLVLLLVVVGVVGGAPEAVAESGPAPVCYEGPDYPDELFSVKSPPACVDFGAVADSESVAEVQQPASGDPAPGFDTITGSFGGPFSQSAEKWRMSPAITIGGGHVYLATDNTSAPYGPGVYMYSTGDGCPNNAGAAAGALCKVAQIPAPGPDQWRPNGIAYYRGKVYVSRTDERRNAIARAGFPGAIHTFDANLNDLGIRRTLALTGLDAAWGELWGRVSEVGGEFGAGLMIDFFAILDPDTGALRGLVPVGLAPSPRIGEGPVALCCPIYYRDYVTAKDVAISPELDVVSSADFSMRRQSSQALLAAEPTAWARPDAVTSLENAINGDPGCLDVGPFQGQKLDSPVGAYAPWGMKWLIQIDSKCWYGPLTYRTKVREYRLSHDLQSGQTSALVKRSAGRAWQPNDQTTEGPRDIAYQAHEPRITWSGKPTEAAWQHGNHTLTYFVSDGEFYVIAKQVERWLDPANGFQNVVLKATPTDAQGAPNGSPITLATSTNWTGTLTINEDTLASGTYQLTMTATIGAGKTVTKTNPNLRIDHDTPTGTLDGGLPAATNAPVDATGTIADAHSGPGKWNLQVNGPGTGGNFQTVCTATAADPSSGKWGCRWSTPAYQEGTYQVRALLADQVQPAYGGANTAPVGNATVIVDRTAPSLANFAPSLDQSSYESVDRNPEPVMWTQSDPGSGINSTTIEVNTAVDGTDSGSWQQIGSSSAAGDTQFDWNSSTVASGLHRFRASSTDRAGNQAQPQWQAILSNARPNAPDACPSCTRWYAGVEAGTGPYFYGWGVKGRFRTPDSAPAVEAPVTYAGDTKSTYQGSSTWVGVGYKGKRAGWYQAGLVSAENCASDPQPGSPGRWYRYFEWTQGGTKSNRIYRFQCYARDTPSAPGGLNTFKITFDSAHRAKGFLNTRRVMFDEDQRVPGYWIDKYGHRQTGAKGETTREGRLMLGFFDQLGWRESAGTTTWTPFNAAHMEFNDREGDSYTINSTVNDDRFCVVGPPPNTCTP